MIRTVAARDCHRDFTIRAYPDRLAPDMERGFGRSVASGALHGAAAWSAYALLEFVFASVLFRLTRPHAVFSAWHWKLTAMLLLGYLIAGPVCGALAGAAAWILRRKVRISVEVGGHLYPGPRIRAACRVGTPKPAGSGCLPPPACSARLLLIRRWNDRAGWLTNYWIVSGLLLGFGQVLGLREMGVASQLGARLGMASLAARGPSAGSRRGFRISRKEVPPAGRPASFRSDRRRRRC